MEKDNQPIFSAYVRLCDAGGVQVAEMFTSDSGEFAFHGIAPAKYTLQISALGFETITLDVDLAFRFRPRRAGLSQTRGLRPPARTPRRRQQRERFGA